MTSSPVPGVLGTSVSSPPPSLDPADPDPGPLERPAKRARRGSAKSVSWAPDEQLTSVRLFYQALPPNMHGVQAESGSDASVDSKPRELVATVPWRKPVDIDLPAELRAHLSQRGQGSIEAGVQRERERSIMARVYLNRAEIPSEPADMAQPDPQPDESAIIHIPYEMAREDSATSTPPPVPAPAPAAAPPASTPAPAPSPAPASSNAFSALLNSPLLSTLFQKASEAAAAAQGQQPMQVEGATQAAMQTPPAAFSAQNGQTQPTYPPPAATTAAMSTPAPATAPSALSKLNLTNLSSLLHSVKSSGIPLSSASSAAASSASSSAASASTSASQPSSVAPNLSVLSSSLQNLTSFFAQANQSAAQASPPPPPFQPNPHLPPPHMQQAPPPHMQGLPPHMQGPPPPFPPPHLMPMQPFPHPGMMHPQGPPGHMNGPPMQAQVAY